MTTVERIKMKALLITYDIGICIAVGLSLGMLFGFGLQEIIMMNKKIDLNMVNDIAASYKKLMAACEEARHAGYVMDAIDELRDHLSALSLETDPDPRAQINRAGGYEAWNALTPEQREAV